MFLPARKAVSTLFIASSQSSRFISRAPIYRLPSQPRCLITPTLRSFSSFTPRRAYQAAAEADLPAQQGQNEFSNFQELADQNIISPRVIDTITQRMNIHTMTDVQKMTLNHCLDGSDVIAQAKTGTGKTLAFLLPIVQRVLRDKQLEDRTRRRAGGDVRALIISPTRELAEQIAVEASKIVSNTAVKVQTAVGGTQKNFHLRKIQQEGCHILVGTPGRVLDIVSDPSSGVSLENIETFVLDEADRLLDIGFAPAIADIQSFMPHREQSPRQTLMFSATVPKTVVQLVRETLRPDFKFIRTVDPNESPTHERIPQHVVFGNALQNQIPIITEILYNAMEAYKADPVNNLPFKAIVYYGSTAEVSLAWETFSKMRDANQPHSAFSRHPFDPCRIYQMHGKLTQQQRTRESQGFRNSETAILFSSDVTARGMDFPNVSHVIQMGMPKNADDYVHRLGRTGRAGKSGEGWLILNNDERKDIHHKMRNSGITLKDAELVTATLDMTRGAQIPANIARLLKLVEAGVTSVPFNVKAATYMALFGVLQQQNPYRSKQEQVDLMNDLAKYGWGLKEPPGVSASLIGKIGFSQTQGLNIEAHRAFDRGNDRGGFGGDRRRNSSFGQGGSSMGAFDGSRSGGRDAFDELGMGGGENSRGGSSGARNGGFGGSRGGFGGSRDRGDRSGGYGGDRGAGGFGGRRDGGFGGRS